MATQKDQAVIDLVINGKQSETSLYNIKTAAVNAQKALSRMAETDPGYAKQKKELEALMEAQQRRIVKINNEKTSWEKFKSSMSMNPLDLVGGVAGGNLVSAGITKLLQLGPAVVDRSLKIKDSFSDIGKAADMSMTEVESLNGQLKQITTRTTTEDLRGIAVVGGQFGIAKKDMADFVASADQLNVALGDQFESVEKVAEVNLTLRNTFQDIKSDNIGEDMLHIGNALNFLEAQGAATAPVMADFSSRIGGVAIPLGLTSGQVLGLSATLQELNVTSERGSTAVVDILNGIAKAPESFAKYARGVDGANLSSSQFKDLVNRDLNGALMAVIRGFKEGDTSATGMAAKLADMDLKGNGVMEVFMKLITNTDLLTQRQAEASEQLKTTSSITGEFDKKNHELAVNLKKLGEWFDSFLENGALMRFADGIVSITVKLLGLNNAEQNLTRNYAEQNKKATDLDNKTKDLVDRYDALAKKSKLSTDEQSELKKLTSQLAGLMPGAVTQFDNYGNAIGVSTTRVRELIQAQREMANQMKAEAKEQQALQLRSLEWDREQMLKKLRSKEDVTVSASGNVTVKPLSPADIAQLQKDLDENYSKVQAVLRDMKETEGLASTADRRAGRRGPEAPKTNSAAGTMETEDERKTREKKEKQQERQNQKEAKTAQKHEDELERMIIDARQRTAEAAGNEFEKEQIAFGEKYSRMFELAGTNKEKQEEITGLMYAELAALQKKQNERELKEAEKHSKELLDLAIKDEELQKTQALNRIRTSVAGGAMTPEQGKVQELEVEAVFLDAKAALYETHYKTLQQLAGDNQKEKDRLETDDKTAEAENDAEYIANQAAIAQANADIRTDDLRKHDQQVKDKVRHDREAAQQRKQIISDIAGVLQADWTSSIQGYKDYWKQATVVQKVALVATKAWALAEIGINLARQISLVNTVATVMDAMLPGSGSIYRIKGMAIAIGTAAVQTAKVIAQGVQAPAFAMGGFTDQEPGGYTNGATYYSKGNFVAGEAGREWIMSAPMLRNPVMANLAGALQALQVSGAWRTLGSPSDQGSTPQGGGGNSDMLLMAMLAKLEENKQAMEAISRRPINYNYFKVQDVKNRVDEIDMETSI